MKTSTVYVVDDDPGVADSLSMLLETRNLNVRTYLSPREFVNAPRLERPSCAIVDLNMPELSGLDVQQALVARGISIPLIFISGHGDVESAVVAMRNGACDFLTKPFDTIEILDRIDQCLKADAEELSLMESRKELAQRLETLTPREREVFGHLIQGLPVKKIGLQLGISHRTAEKHRDRILKKMQAGNVVNLLQMAVTLRLVTASTDPPV